MFEEPPVDLVLGRIEGFVMIAAFKAELGPAQRQGGLTPGMVILQVNKQNVTNNQTPEDVMEMMKIGENNTPIEATENPAERIKLAVRDMDSFMHLIRIRDGQESINDVIDIRDALK